MLSRVVFWRIKDDDDDDIDAEARFVLLQMAALLPHQAKQATAEEWARVLGVPEAGLIPRLRQLAAVGYLVRGSLQGEQRGRPQHDYLWDPKSVPGQVVGSERLEALIEQLVTGAGRHQPKPRLGGKPVPPPRAGAGKVLSPANRMVLSVLLTFADAGGVVRGRGTAELAVMSGLSRGRFVTHVEKLTGLGFIRSHVPGVSSRPLLGVAAGTFFLNLGHPGYGSQAVPGMAYAFPCTGGLLEYQDRWYGDIERLMRVAKVSLNLIEKYERQDKGDGSRQPAESTEGVQRPLIAVLDALPLSQALAPVQTIVHPDTDLDRFRSEYPGWFTDLEERPGLASARISLEILRRLAKILDASHRQGLGNYLQHLLESHASQLLTEHRKEAGAVNTAGLQDRIFEGLYPSTKDKSDADALLTVEAIRLLAGHLARRARDLALHCYQQMGLFEGKGGSTSLLSRQPDSYVILPWTTAAGDLMTVVASYTDAEVSGQESWLLVATGEEYKEGSPVLKVDVIKVGISVDKEQLYRQGLLQRPRKEIT